MKINDIATMMIRCTSLVVASTERDLTESELVVFSDYRKDLNVILEECPSKFFDIAEQAKEAINKEKDQLFTKYLNLLKENNESSAVILSNKIDNMQKVAMNIMSLCFYI